MMFPVEESLCKPSLAIHELVFEITFITMLTISPPSHSNCSTGREGEQQGGDVLKYLYFRIEQQWVKDGKVVDGWFILCQRSTDLNWSLLHEAASFEGAKEFIRGIRESADQLVYGTDGYTINI